jgi:hypothetical protein
MKVDKSRGTFRDVIREHSPQVKKIAQYLRRLTAGVHPDAIEVPRPAENHASYAIGSGRPSEVFAYICPLKDYVRFGFYYGGELPDPEALLVGSGKRLRHVKLYTLEQAERPAIRALLAAAVAQRIRAAGGANERLTKTAP